MLRLKSCKVSQRDPPWLHVHKWDSAVIVPFSVLYFVSVSVAFPLASSPILPALQMQREKRLWIHWHLWPQGGATSPLIGARDCAPSPPLQVGSRAGPNIGSNTFSILSPPWVSSCICCCHPVVRVGASEGLLWVKRRVSRVSCVFLGWDCHNTDSEIPLGCEHPSLCYLGRVGGISVCILRI